MKRSNEGTKSSGCGRGGRASSPQPRGATLQRRDGEGSDKVDDTQEKEKDQGAERTKGRSTTD